ncbi:MAG TPA: SGNH hydrolase domain-containing protein, partial [Bradyrhizobium sp.]
QGPLPHRPLPPCPSIPRQDAEQSTGRIDRFLARLQAKWPDKVELLRPVDYFCDTECPVVKDGIWFYQNRIHLTLAGTQYMMARSGDVFRRFLQN